MFDTAKVRRMTSELEEFARKHEDIYVIPEWLTPDAFALFRRMKLTVRAIAFPSMPRFAQKEIFGYPVMILPEAIKNFTTRTGIILLSTKSQPLLAKRMNFTVGNQQLTVPLFALSSEEALAIYDRLTLMKIFQQYQEDGLQLPSYAEVGQRFARGLTTFINPDSQNIKIQFWERDDSTVPKYDVDDTAIVLRGQIVHENSYTEKTIEFYRTVYPNTTIVVSTWKNEITPEFREVCKKNSVDLLENIQPAIPGFGNINYQLENAFKGVEYVQKNFGKKFVLVTRTDQRLNKSNFLLHFRNLIQEFPPLNDKLQGRILILGSWLTMKYVPFSSTDFLSFGFVSDILKLYSLPRLKDFGEHGYFIRHKKRFYDMRSKLVRAAFENCSFVKHRKRLKKFNMMINKFVDVDIFWLKNFYRKYIAPLDETKLLETWWKLIQDYLLFVDSNDLFLDWPKHDNGSRYNTAVGGTDFSQWLNLYRNFNLRLGL